MIKNGQSKKEYIEKQFENQVGYFPNIDNPKTFNEKIQWLKLYYKDPLMTQCADKYKVREYVEKKIGKKYLIPLLGVYDNVNEIDFNKLPKKFVLKTNNGSGKNIICKDKNKLNIDDAKLKLKEWMEPNRNHYFYSYEWAYKNIKPKIICEKYIEQKNHKLSDYRFLCFFGKPKYVWLDTDSANENINHKRNVFDLKWNEVDVEIGHTKNKSNNIKKPINLAEMIALANILSKDFPHVRVDFYNINGKIYFGELTFYSQNGMAKFKPEEWDYKIGNHLDIKKITNDQLKKYLEYKKTRKAEIVIYTAFSDNYDNLITPKYISKKYDYVCFTDKKIKNPGVWEIRPLVDIKQDLVRTARHHKIFPNKLISNYRYSIWIDSNIDILDDTLEKKVTSLIRDHIKISVGIHPKRKCVYQEIKTCLELKMDRPSIIQKQTNFLKKEKYPKNNGLFETNIIFREHNNTKIIKLMEDWWWMVKNFSRRDQLSFNYVLWKNKINCIPTFSKSERKMLNSFNFNTHNSKITTILSFNDDIVQKQVIVSTKDFKTKFKLNTNKKIKSIFLNIISDKCFKFKINEIIIKHKKKISKIKFSKIKFTTNGDILENNLIDFYTKVPEIKLDIKPKLINTLKIIGEIYFYDIQTEYSNLLSKLKDNSTGNRYNIDVFNKLIDSKFFKLWPIYNKIKKILKINE